MMDTIVLEIGGPLVIDKQPSSLRDMTFSFDKATKKRPMVSLNSIVSQNPFNAISDSMDCRGEGFILYQSIPLGYSSFKIWHLEELGVVSSTS